MKRLLTAWALFAALVSSGAELLRIADATGGSGGAVTAALLQFSSERRGVEVSLRKLDAGDAFEKLDAGDLDLVLVNGPDLPVGRRPAAFRYATAAYVACVSAQNPLRRIRSKDLRLLFDTPGARWDLLGGSPAAIHRFGVAGRDGRLVGGAALKIVDLPRDVLLLSTMAEAVIMAENDPAALIWGPFGSELPLSVVALELDGVVPSRNNIRDGSYPLCIPRFAVSRPEPSAAARAFLELLRSGGFARLVEEDGELGELPEIAK